MTLAAFADAPRQVGGIALEPVTFAALAGWSGDDHGEAFAAFRRSCEALAQGRAPLRPGLIGSDALIATCRKALAEPADLDRDAARRFFERRFEPFRLEAGESGFLTAYFEPEIDGARAPSARFPTPLLERPGDLVSFNPGETPRGLDPVLAAARRVGDAVEPYPERAAIEDGELGALAVPLVHVDPVDAFMTQVQGSARVRLQDGSVLRLAYAGRNGWPYTSVGKVLAGELGVPARDMTAERVYGWLRANPGEARRVMRRNRSYVFYRLASELKPGDGPLGGASVQLVPGRSLAIDRTLWPYGLPIFVETSLPRPGGGQDRFARLAIAQDTGTAIVGAARADLFLGSGPAAGTRAGLVRQVARFTVLLPNRPDD